MPDLVCRLDAEVNFSPPLGVRVEEAEVTGHIGYLDCRSPSGAAPELTDIVFGVDGTGRFGVFPPTFSVEGNGGWAPGTRVRSAVSTSRVTSSRAAPCPSAP